MNAASSSHGTRSLAILTCGLFVLLSPWAARAGVTIESRHRANLSVEGSEASWVRVGTTRPLALRVTGPGTLHLELRREIHGRPQAVALVYVFRDGRRIAKVRLTNKQPVAITGTAVRAGAARHTRVVIPGGSHRVRVKVVGRRQTVLVAYTFEAETPAIPPVVSLTEPAGDGKPMAEADVTAVPLVPLEEGGAQDAPETTDAQAAAPDIGAIPLVALAPENPPSSDETTAQAITAIDLVPLTDERDEGTGSKRGETKTSETPGPALADAGHPVTVDTLEAGSSAPAGGVLVGAPLVQEPGAPARSGPRHMLLGLRLVAARVGVRTGALGGGIDLLYRPGWRAGALLFGLSVDLLPQRLVHETTPEGQPARRLDASLSSVPVLVAGAYEIHVGRQVRLLASVGAGAAWVQVSMPARSGSALHPAFALAFGPALDVGPGQVTASLRLAGSYGAIVAEGTDKTALLERSFLGSGALTLGYAVTF